MLNITPKELAERLAGNQSLILLDVREDWERQIAHIANDTHIPMSLVPVRVSELDKSKPLAIYCHHGGRSAQVANFLEQRHGFTNVINLAGGIDSWAQEVDTSLARY